MGQSSARAAQQSWQYRAIAVTRGNQTLIGTVLLAVLGKSYRLSGKRFGQSAVILANGQVCSAYQSVAGDIHEHMPICLITELIDGFRRLADTLQLGDDERAEMFTELRKWFSRDDRPKPEWQTGAPILPQTKGELH